MSPRAEKSGKSNLASPARHLRAANARAEGGNGCSLNKVQRVPHVGGDSRKGTTHEEPQKTLVFQLENSMWKLPFLTGNVRCGLGSAGFGSRGLEPEGSGPG